MLFLHCEFAYAASNEVCCSTFFRTICTRNRSLNPPFFPKKFLRDSFVVYRHLFLGQMLLLGLLLGSCVGFAYAVEPNEFSCAAVKLGTGLSYGLIYTSLLVKQIFLISLNSGVYLPASYQAILFLFIIITQVTKKYLKKIQN